MTTPSNQLLNCFALRIPLPSHHASIPPSARASVAGRGKESPVEVRIHGKHMDVSDSLRKLATEKVDHAARVFEDSATFADVEFAEEQNPRISEERYRVEITANVAGQVMRVEAAAFDDRAALDIAVDVFERQLRRLKENNLVVQEKEHSPAGTSRAMVSGPGSTLPRLLDDVQGEWCSVVVEHLHRPVGAAIGHDNELYPLRGISLGTKRVERPPQRSTPVMGRNDHADGQLIFHSHTALFMW